jgi:hypothetical protein
MPSTTGIELGPDSCVLAGVRTTRSGAEIIALHTVEPAAWPAHDVAFAEMLRGVRTSKKFPKSARVVAWGLPEDATLDDITRAAMRPLVGAGFRIDRVVTPPQALAILAGTRVKSAAQNTGVVWLALNMHGAAIAVVRGAELVFGRTFQWTYNPYVLETKAQLLQRYSLIAHLAPEVRRGIAAARASHGISVDAVVTCGDLPELRSLTMPLIEELDLEVETLDSMEGLRAVGKARLERLAESAPALRLASAVALAGAERPRASGPPAARIAAALAAVAALGYGAYTYFTRPVVSTPPPRTTQTTTRPPAKPPVKATPKQAPPAVPAAVPRVGPNAAQVTQASTEKERNAPPVRQIVPPRPTPQGSSAARSVAPPKPSTPVSSPPATPPKPDLIVSSPPAKGASERATAGAADTRGVIFPKSPRAAAQPAPPLKDPLPIVDSILIDQERRLALIDGAITALGDQIGPRVVAQIDREGVVLREPSGLLIRVSLRSR